MDSFKPILHIEDDDIDAMAVARALKTLKISNELIRKVNGEDALNYLKNENNQKPGVILLDVNMPRMNGREFLWIAGKDPDLRKIPIIVLFTSDSDRDLTGTNVVGCISKSLGFNDFVACLKSELEKLNSDCPIT